MKIIDQYWWLKLVVAFAILGSQMLTLKAIAGADPNLIIKVNDSEENAISMDVMPPKLLEATVTIKGSFINLKGSRMVPFTIDLSTARQDMRNPVSIFRAVAKDPSKGIEWDTDFSFQVGIRGGSHNNNLFYYLPYHPMAMHQVVQGYGGSSSHQRGTPGQFAIDFEMPIGSVVCAARPGLVVAIRTDSNRGGPSQDFEDDANYVVIKHDDGTYGLYQHLKQNGALVRLGDLVQARQPIALSGNTGISDAPHLHFEVYTPIDGDNRQSIPVLFQTRMGIVPMLQEGVTY